MKIKFIIFKNFIEREMNLQYLFLQKKKDYKIFVIFYRNLSIKPRNVWFFPVKLLLN